jgi:hypothetical protein
MRGLLARAIPLVALGCSTSSGFLDVAMPDRFGTGTAFGKGDYSSRIVSGGDLGMEDGTYDEQIHAIWLEWDLPSISDDPRTSIVDMRDRVVEDYTAYRKPEPPPESLISITKQVDEATGEESWSLGTGAALTSALTALLGYLGFRLTRGRTAAGEPPPTEEEE